MADNYTQFSLALSLTAEEKTWVHNELTRMDNEETEERTGCGFEWSTYSDDSGDTLMLYSEEGCDLERVAEFCQAYLAQFYPDKHIGFTWAETCSKPRPDEFGGGACLVTATDTKWMNTHQWLDEMGRLMLNPKLHNELRSTLDSLIEAAKDHDGPPAEEIHLAFTDADDYPEFDVHPDVNYLTGILIGAADALEVPMLDLLHELRKEG